MLTVRVATAILLMSALAQAAYAQLRLPVVPLPAQPVQKLTQSLVQNGSDSLAQLGELRRLQLARLLRANPGTLAVDPRGNLIIRDELLAYSPADRALETAQTLGFKILRQQSSGELGLRLVVLQPPPMRIARALKQLRELDPTGIYDFNHVYSGSGQVFPPGVQPAARPDANADNRVDPGQTSRVGLVDGGVDDSHPVFHDAVIHSWGCGGRVMASSHGTAVASLLIGHSERFRGVLDKAELYAADVYCNAPNGGAVDALTAAFSWLAQRKIAVINVSLVGPDNAVLANLVRALVARGFVLVAAVGNDGPAAPPLYPASYAGVVGVTGVDAHRRVLIEAARGNQVMFAAPGADMAAAAVGEKFAAVRGTSFAAPFVAGLLARGLSMPDSGASRSAIEELARNAVDLGSHGRDLTYGYGLVGADLRPDPSILGR